MLNISKILLLIVFFKQFKNQLCTNKLIFNAFDYKHL